MEKKFLSRQIKELTEVEGWQVVPSVVDRRVELGGRKIEKVDAVEKLGWLLNDSALLQKCQSSLRILDLADGCGWNPIGSGKRGTPCETCITDSPLVAQRFSTESIFNLFGDKRFLNIVSSKSLRLGGVANLLDLPDGLDMARNIVEATEGVCRRLKIYVNYRPQSGYQDRLRGLTELALASKRLRLYISLPYNSSSEVNQSFDDYIKEEAGRRGCDLVERSLTADGSFSYPDEYSLFNDSVRIIDVRHSTNLIFMGRMQEEMGEEARGREWDGDRLFFYQMMGLGNLYLNPSGLWWKVNLPASISYTGQAFHLIDSPQAFEQASHLSQHPDFFTKENSWPGGFGGLMSIPKARQVRKLINNDE